MQIENKTEFKKDMIKNIISGFLLTMPDSEM